MVYFLMFVYKMNQIYSQMWALRTMSASLLQLYSLLNFFALFQLAHNGRKSYKKTAWMSFNSGSYFK